MGEDAEVQRILALVEQVNREVVTQAEAGRLLGVSRERVGQLIRSGKLKAGRALGTYLIPRSHVNQRLIDLADSRASQTRRS